MGPFQTVLKKRHWNKLTEHKDRSKKHPYISVGMAKRKERAGDKDGGDGGRPDGKY